ncbi:hypothetical protein ABT297_25735 [Dactylosporangium sp. NPDC000555]|uniref:hypothetical protein n=1 Tax=Dactylosporangium sp. NPDC000555 TaxID=3154260 RepID=UPI00331F483F
MKKLGGEARLEIVPNATHLSEEPGTGEQVAQLARERFVEHLTPVPEHRRQRSGR